MAWPCDNSYVAFQSLPNGQHESRAPPEPHPGLWPELLHESNLALLRKPQCLHSRIEPLHVLDQIGSLPAGLWDYRDRSHNNWNDASPCQSYWVRPEELREECRSFAYRSEKSRGLAGQETCICTYCCHGPGRLKPDALL